MKSPIYTVPELTRIVRVVGLDLGLFMSLFPEMELFSTSWLVKLLSCVRDFLHMRSKYRRRTFVLIISGDIHGASGLIL